MTANCIAMQLDRRAFMVTGAKAGVLLGALGVVAGAGVCSAVAGGPSKLFQKAYADVVGTAQPADHLITLDLPDLFDNGHAVPFSITVESPMSSDDYIQRVWMLSTQNPFAQIASFHMSPATGAAIVSGRFRLAKSQDVYVIAQRNDDALFVSKQLVKVTIGGCS